MSLLNIFNISGSAMRVQSQKMNVIANNLANADSMISKNGVFSPYIAKKVIFQLDPQNNSLIGGVKIGAIINVKNPTKLIYDPYHPMANSKGYVVISNVNPVTETINNISAARSYQSNIEVLKTVKSMIIKTLNMGE